MKRIQILIILLTLLILSACREPSDVIQVPVTTPVPVETIEADTGSFFSLTDSIYDGSSLSLVCDMESMKCPIDFAFGPDHPLFAQLINQPGLNGDWSRHLRAEDKATVERKWEENGSVGFIARVSYVGDTIRLADGTDLGPFNRIEENGKIYYSPQTGLFGATADQEQLVLTFTVMTQPVYVWLEGDVVQMYYAPQESREASMTIRRSIPEADALPPGMERTVHVNSVDEFLSAIGPYTHIIIEAPVLELNTASDYGSEGGKYYRWESVPDSGGYSLVIHDVDRLSVSGLGAETTSILTDCGAADVITFSNCKNPMIQALTLGHISDSNTSSGLALQDCYGSYINVCCFPGTNAVGILAVNCSDIMVQSTVILNCPAAGVILDTCKNVEFWLLDVRDCPADIVNHGDCSSILREGTALTSQ